MERALKVGAKFLLSVLLAVLVYLTALQCSRRRDVPLEELLVDGSELSSVCELGEQEPDQRWDGRTHLDPVPGSAAFPYAIEAQSRSWSRGPGIVVYRHRTPIVAAVQFWLARPELYYFDHLPNFNELPFLPGSGDAKRYPANWRYQAAADQELVVCAMGDPSDCAYWFYQVRYGQYIVAMSFFERDVSAERWQRVTDVVNLHLIRKLDQTK
ncbi:MAG: hypothetical protein C4334_05960 [Pyrinomonas sp.]|uniref:hypothetical protein n=1 Tax=Pyrinomonas sp. TaxID=2080306 RepID=UPI00332882D7